MATGVLPGEPSERGRSKKRKRQYFSISKKRRRRSAPVSKVKPTAAPSVLDARQTTESSNEDHEDSEDFTSVENAVLLRPQAVMKEIKRKDREVRRITADTAKSKCAGKNCSQLRRRRVRRM